VAAAKDDTKTDAKAVEAPATRLAWVVTYPAISVQPKGDDGEPNGDPVTLTQGQALPADCEWQGPFLVTIGHVTPLQVATQ
jgi:hypothetical protein